METPMLTMVSTVRRRLRQQFFKIKGRCLAIVELLPPCPQRFRLPAEGITTTQTGNYREAEVGSQQLGQRQPNPDLRASSPCGPSPILRLTFLSGSEDRSLLHTPKFSSRVRGRVLPIYVSLCLFWGRRPVTVCYLNPASKFEPRRGSHPQKDAYRT